MASLGKVKAVNQPVVAFLILILVKGELSILADGLLYHLSHNLKFVLQFGLLFFQFGSVKNRRLYEFKVSEDFLPVGE